MLASIVTVPGHPKIDLISEDLGDVVGTAGMWFPDRNGKPNLRKADRSLHDHGWARVGGWTSTSAGYYATIAER